MNIIILAIIIHLDFYKLLKILFSVNLILYSKMKLTFDSHHKSQFWCYDKNEKIPNDVSMKCRRAYWFICPVNPRHQVFKISIRKILEGKWCKKCKSSKGENEIRRILSNNNIEHLEQYKIKPNNYRYDFYLVKQNLLIEFQGNQHYAYTKYFHKTITRFQEQLERDSFKKAIALRNHYNYLEINHKDFKNLENILSKYMF
jgi:very-short-patch-repair endonuclease